MTQDELVTSIVERIAESAAPSVASRCVAISGVDCAGKSTLARAVHERLGRVGLDACLISIDDFLIPLDVRARREPESLGYFEDAFDYEALTGAVASARSPETRGSVVIVEGVFLLRTELRQWWDLTIWLEIDPVVAMDRAIRRDAAYFGDPETVRRVYEQRCQPAQALHAHRDRPQSSAQLIARFENGEWALERVS